MRDKNQKAKPQQGVEEGGRKPCSSRKLLEVLDLINQHRIPQCAVPPSSRTLERFEFVVGFLSLQIYLVY